MTSPIPLLARALLLALALLAARPAGAAAEKCVDSDADGPDLPRRRGVQKRDFQKALRHELSLKVGLYGADLGDSSPTFGAAWAFFVTEELGLETTWMRATLRSSPVEAVERSQLGGQLRLFEPRDYSLYHADLLWVPIHAKLMLFADVVLHLDIGLAAGAGVNADGATTGLTYNAGPRFDVFLARWLSLRLDVRDYVHRQEVLGVDSVANDLVATTGLALWLPFWGEEP